MAGIDDLSSLSLSRPQRNEKHRIVLWKFNGRRLVGNGLSMKFSGLFSGLGEEVSLLSLHKRRVFRGADSCCPTVFHN